MSKSTIRRGRHLQWQPGNIKLKVTIFRQEHLFVLLLGLCPTLAISTSALNALSLGIATVVVLVSSNCLILLIKKDLPEKLYFLINIFIIATLVTIIELLLKAISPTLHNSLGIYLPLLVVNTLILERVESTTQHKDLKEALEDGVEKGLSFSLALFLIGSLREILGSGTFFSIPVLFNYKPMFIMLLPPGGFLIMGFILAYLNYRKNKNGIL